MDTPAKSTKNRVSNEQILNAIMAQTTALNGLVQVLAGKSVAQPVPVEAPAHNQKIMQEIKPQPVKFAQSTPVMANPGRLIAHLPQATEIPRGINVEWLGGLEKKAARWAQDKGVTEPVFVYFVTNSFGQHKPLFGRASSKVSQNAVSIYKRVN